VYAVQYSRLMVNGTSEDTESGCLSGASAAGQPDTWKSSSALVLVQQLRVPLHCTDNGPKVDGRRGPFLFSGDSLQAVRRCCTYVVPST
jgi:hypothetical protein